MRPLFRHSSASKDVRKVDIAHSGQTVDEAIQQVVSAIKEAQHSRTDALLVVHGYGASGQGGLIKAALADELPRLARLYRFRIYRDEDRVPEGVSGYRRQLNRGSTLLVFRSSAPASESAAEFRPNFRNLRKRVKVRSARGR